MLAYRSSPISSSVGCPTLRRRRIALNLVAIVALLLAAACSSPAAEEFAGTVRFLCGPHSRFTTGQTLHVNGGWYVSIN